MLGMLALLRPGYLSPSAGLKFADIPNGLAAVSKVPVGGWAQIAAYFGFVEFSGGFDDYKTGTPGDYGFKVLTSADSEADHPDVSFFFSLEVFIEHSPSLISFFLLVLSTLFLKGEDQEALSRACKRPFGHDGNHRHVLSGARNDALMLLKAGVATFVLHFEFK